MDLEEFDVIGISVRTVNEPGKFDRDIPKLWERFFTENILEKIPNKIDSSIYSVYTEYEGDYTQPYTVILGCKVKNLTSIPEGLVGKTVPGGNFAQFTAHGDLSKGAVYSEWTKIWKTPLDRKYSADFEVYGIKAQNPQNAAVDIFIAVS